MFCIPVLSLYLFCAKKSLTYELGERNSRRSVESLGNQDLALPICASLRWCDDQEPVLSVKLWRCKLQKCTNAYKSHCLECKDTVPLIHSFYVFQRLRQYLTSTLAYYHNGSCCLSVWKYLIKARSGCLSQGSSPACKCCSLNSPAGLLCSFTGHSKEHFPHDRQQTIATFTVKPLVCIVALAPAPATCTRETFFGYNCSTLHHSVPVSQSKLSHNWTNAKPCKTYFGLTADNILTYAPLRLSFVCRTFFSLQLKVGFAPLYERWVWYSHELLT